MNKQYEYAVFIGRFQPPHKAHIEIIEKALKIAQTVVVVLGSNRSAPNTKNPWSATERIDMISSCFPFDENFIRDTGKTRIQYVSVRDYLYNDNIWIAELQQKIKEKVGESKSIVMVGADKDRTSRYLQWFPQWDQKLFPLKKEDSEIISSTMVRDMYFNYIAPNSIDARLYNVIPHTVYAKLLEDKRETKYETFRVEYNYYQDYMKPYKDLPYPPTFTTTDVVIVKAGHVLLVRRRVPPGVNLLALPGGFLDQGEWLIDSAFREVKEETRIKVSQKFLKEHIKEQRVFDHPDRSLRGRTITYAYYVRLPDEGELPAVKGGDDAKAALWLPIGDLALNEEQFFEDHLHIIHHFINR